MKHPGHTYGGFVPVISEWGMTPDLSSKGGGNGGSPESKGGEGEGERGAGTATRGARGAWGGAAWGWLGLAARVWLLLGYSL
jgi:hypothetical protein